MIHIVKSKKTNQFYVIVTGRNNEKLSTSELLKTKQSAWKNIKAQVVVFNTSFVCLVQDNTTGKIYSVNDRVRVHERTAPISPCPIVK